MTKIRNQKLLKQFGKNLRKLRLEKNLTQEQLAEEAGISQVQIARMEAGQLNTTISSLYNLSKALEVSFDRFFD